MGEGSPTPSPTTSQGRLTQVLAGRERGHPRLDLARASLAYGQSSPMPFEGGLTWPSSDTAGVRPSPKIGHWRKGKKKRKKKKGKKNENAFD